MQPQPSTNRPADVDITRARSLSTRFDALRGLMHWRGLLSQDLEQPQQLVLRRFESDLAAGDFDRAEAALDTIEQSVRDMRIDGPFVRRKLDRMNRLVRSADPSRVNTAELHTISNAALQEYLAGQFEAANTRLNRLWQLLTRANQD